MRCVISKLIAVMLAVSLLISLLGSTCFADGVLDTAEETEAAAADELLEVEIMADGEQPPWIFTAEEGGITIEAESFTPDPTRIAIQNDADASGGKAAVTQGTSTNDYPDASAYADFDLSYTSPETATYYIWVRVKPNYALPTYTISKDGEKHVYAEFTKGQQYYSWYKIDSVLVTAGTTRYVKIRRRHPTVYFDKFIITNDVDLLPHNAGDTHRSGAEVVFLPDNAYQKPPAAPTGQHPSLWFTADDIPAIKENMTHPESKEYYDRYNTYRRENGSWLRTGTDYSPTRMTVLEAKALDYAVNGNETYGRQAYEAFMAHSAIADYSNGDYPERQLSYLITVGAKIYDWCYDLLTEKERAALIRRLEARSAGLAVGYPPNQGGAVTGHASEESLLSALLSFGIATYSERPDIYNYVAGRIFQEYAPVRNYYYKSGSHYQGTDYGAATRFGWDLHAAYLLYKAVGVHPFDYDSMESVLYENIYSRRPDGQTLRIGDNWTQIWAGDSDNNYWSTAFPSLFVAAAYFKNPYFKREAARQNISHKTMELGSSGDFTFVLYLILNDPALKGKSSANLPLSHYYSSPNGAIIARTGWSDGKDAPDVHAHMKIGEMWGGNHAHLDMGSFTLYYKGALAIDSGLYTSYGSEHHAKYSTGGIAHNIITVYNPSEVIPTDRINDGGYRWPSNGGEAKNYDEWVTSGKYDMAEVTAHEIGPDAYTPEYSYIAGDMTKAYSDKVSESLRSMVFMPLDDEEHPAALVVMDKITSSNAQFKKSWLLHMQEEPTVEGNKTIVTRKEYGYNGRMVNETLLPKTTNIEKIGGEGKQFWVVDKNIPITGSSYEKYSRETAEVGWGRVEVSPAAANTTDYFLNVMTVSDADTTAADIESTLIEGDNIAGAAFSDRAIVFNKNKERIASSVTFTVPEGTRKVFVCGLKAGTWDINGTEAVASEDGGCVYADVSSAKVTMTYKNTNAEKTLTSNKPEETDAWGMVYGTKHLYSHTKPYYKNGSLYIDIYNILNGLGIEAAKTEKGVSAEMAGDKTVTMSVNAGESVAEINGTKFPLDAAAEMVNGDLMVPSTLLKQAFNYGITEEPYAHVLILSEQSSSYGILNAAPGENGKVIINAPGNADATIVTVSYGGAQRITGVTYDTIKIEAGMNTYELGKLTPGQKIMLWRKDSARAYCNHFLVK